MNDWFFYQDQGQTLGPFTLEDLRGRIRTGQLKFHDLVYRDGEESWQIAVQHPAVKPEFQLDLNVGLEDRPWVCLHRKAEDTFDFVTVGPFSDEDIQGGLREGTLAYGDYAWKHGMAEWIRIGSTERFNSRLKSDFVETPPPMATLSSSAPLENEPPPIDDRSIEDVEVLHRHSPTPPPLPVEANGEDLTKQDETGHDFDPDRTRINHTGVGTATFSFKEAPTKPSPVPAPVEDDWDRTRILTTTPEVKAPAEKQIETQPIEFTTKQNLFDKLKARPWTDWTIVASVVCALFALFFVMHKRHARVAPPVAQVTAPAPVVAVAPAPVPVRARDPQLAKPLPPAQFQVKADTLNPETLHLTLHSDASINFPITVQVIGLPGQVMGGASSYQVRNLKATGLLGTPVADTNFKVAPGRYLIRVEGGATRRDLEYSHQLNDSNNVTAIARARKLNYAAIYQERLAIYKMCLKLEAALNEAHGLRPPSTKGLESVLALTRGEGAKTIFFLDWWEMKELLEKALKTPSAGDLDRAHKLHARISQFSVWGRVGAG